MAHEQPSCRCSPPPLQLPGAVPPPPPNPPALCCPACCRMRCRLRPCCSLPRLTARGVPCPSAPARLSEHFPPYPTGDKRTNDLALADPPTRPHACSVQWIHTTSCPLANGSLPAPSNTLYKRCALLLLALACPCPALVVAFQRLPLLPRSAHCAPCPLFFFSSCPVTLGTKCCSCTGSCRRAGTPCGAAPRCNAGVPTLQYHSHARIGH